MGPPRWLRKSLLIALVFAGTLLIVPFASSVPQARSEHLGTFALPFSGCLPSAYTSPDSLRIPNAPPGAGLSSLGSGTTFGAEYELKASKLPASKHGTPVLIPVASAVFPTGGTTTYVLSIPAQSLNLSSLSTWSAPLGASLTLSAPLNFSSGTARLSTSWVAVVAKAPANSVRLHFQWRWWTNVSGVVTFGHWSHVITVNNTSEQPTAFNAAPWVGTISTTGASAPGGTNYTAVIQGHVTSTYFRMVVETTNGKELNSACLSTVGLGKITSYNATLPLDNFNGTAIAPGNYIVHIHDSLNAMVVVAKVAVT
ncbi:MAG: hypothetical protein ACHQ2Y_07135 [Candidatus Lutacidiplasmatales archaeon]